MSIYVITSGELDSFAVLGYCTTEALAKGVCAKMNGNPRKYDLFSSVDYSELKCFDLDSESDCEIYYRYRAEIEQEKRTGEVFVDRVRLEFITSEYLEPKFLETLSDGPKYKHFQFNFCISEKNDKYAREVAEEISERYFRLLV